MMRFSGPSGKLSASGPKLKKFVSFSSSINIKSLSVEP